MKVGSSLFVLLALGALSMNAATARHHDRGTSAANQSRTHSPRLAKSSIAAGKQQNSGSPPLGAAAGETNRIAAQGGSKGISSDKQTGDDASTHNRKPTSAGAVTDAAPDRARATDRGSRHIATSGAGANSKEGAADTAIDTSITVHQGRETFQGGRTRLFKRPGTAVAAGNGTKHQHDGNRRRQSSAPSAAGPHRNAIGVAVDSDKIPGRGIAAGRPAAASTAATAVAPTPVSTAQGAIAASRDPNAKAVIGNVPVMNLNAGAVQTGNHAFGTAALTIVSGTGPNISGTGLNRPASVTGAIGGPAKSAVGIISGNRVRLKHP